MVWLLCAQEIVVAQLMPLEAIHEGAQEAVLGDLLLRERCGVCEPKTRSVKDFYVLPLRATDPVPESLLPFEGPGAFSCTRSAACTTHTVVVSYYDAFLLYKLLILLSTKSFLRN